MTPPLAELEDANRRREPRPARARSLTVSLCGVLVAGAVAWPSDRLWLLLAAAGLAAYPHQARPVRARVKAGRR